MANGFPKFDSERRAAFTLLETALALFILCLSLQLACGHLTLAKKLQTKITQSDHIETQLATIQLEQFLAEMAIVDIKLNGREVCLVNRQQAAKSYKLQLRKKAHEVIVTNWDNQGYMLLWYRVDTVKFTYQAPLLKMTLTMTDGEKLQHYFLVPPKQSLEE